MEIEINSSNPSAKSSGADRQSRNQVADIVKALDQRIKAVGGSSGLKAAVSGGGVIHKKVQLNRPDVVSGHASAFAGKGGVKICEEHKQETPKCQAPPSSSNHGVDVASVGIVEEKSRGHGRSASATGGGFDRAAVKRVVSLGYPQAIDVTLTKYKRKSMRILINYVTHAGQTKQKTIFFGRRDRIPFIIHKDEARKRTEMLKLHRCTDPFEANFYELHLLNGASTELSENYAALLKYLGV